MSFLLAILLLSLRHEHIHGHFLLDCEGRHHASCALTKTRCILIIQVAQLQHSRQLTELPKRWQLCNCLWPLVPDVMKRHLHWGQLITQFHRWIHSCSNQTWGALMLERHYNISWHAHMVKTECTQTGDVRGPRGSNKKVSGLLPVLPVSPFTARYTGEEHVLLQFTSAVSDFPEGHSPDSPANRAVRCNLGYISLNVLQYAATGTQTVLGGCICAWAPQNGTTSSATYLDTIGTIGKCKETITRSVSMCSSVVFWAGSWK